MQDYGYTPRIQKKRWLTRKRVFVFIGIMVAGALFFTFLRASNMLTVSGSVGSYPDFSVEREEDRIDVLILGIRGAGDPNGGLLADTMVLASFDKKTKKAAMVSIPRDLYVEMPDHGPEKINFAYALGETRSPGGGGLTLSKEVVQYVSGVYIDHAIVLNFEGFKRVVDTLGGVTITRDTPFTESQQWRGERVAGSSFWVYVEGTAPLTEEALDEVAISEEEGGGEEEGGESVEEEPATTEGYWMFQVPKGTHTLKGDDALYYIRSRYSSSDFDRVRRQQEVIDALKKQALTLGVLANPFKVFEVIDALGKNIRTDMSLGDIREFISLAQEYQSIPVNHAVLEPTEGGIIYAGTSSSGAYILSPRAGDWDEVRAFFSGLLSQ
ncbi:MAG: LCP family protein [Candidatus Spechtbacterales bacterium]